MWDLPGPGLEPVSPALAVGFLATVPPGKSPSFILNHAHSRPVRRPNSHPSPLEGPSQPIPALSVPGTSTDLLVYPIDLIFNLTLLVVFFFFLKEFLYFYYLFIYLFMAVLGLRFCARAFSSCGKRGPLFIAVRGPLTVAASLVAEHRLQMRRLSSCGSRA